MSRDDRAEPFFRFGAAALYSYVLLKPYICDKMAG